MIQGEDALLVRRSSVKTGDCAFGFAALRVWKALPTDVTFAPTLRLFLTVVTARCTLVQSAVLRSHVVCLSVRPSVRPSVCL